MGKAIKKEQIAIIIVMAEQLIKYMKQSFSPMINGIKFPI